MVFHFASERPPASSIIHLIVFNGAGLGWTGVDLFFVLSGFLITGILLDSKGSPGYLRVFFIRRSLRILPLYYLSVLASFSILPLLVSRFLNWRWPQVAPAEQLWYWFYIANWRTAFHPLVYPIATHLWSLAIEEQFYLFWPFVVLQCSRLRLLQISLAGILFAFLLRNLPWAQALGAAYPNSLYRLTPFRIDSLLFGACAALVIRDSHLMNQVSRWIKPAFLTGVAALGMVLADARSTSPHSAPMTRFGFTALGLTFVSAVLYSHLHAGDLSGIPHFLRSRLLRHFGRYSYAMYLFHIPVATFLPRLPATIWGGLLTGLVAVVTGVAITDGLARLSWFAIESPFLQLKDRFTPDRYANGRAHGQDIPVEQFSRAAGI